MKNLTERMELIKSRINTVEKEQRSGHPIETFTIKGWRETNITKPVIKLDTDYLMFRIDNSRTLRQQLHYLHINGLPTNFFSDPESKEVQQAQEEILKELIHNSANGQNFINDLKTGQDEPAIITFEGYLVNGNRRVAALKELGTQFINCVVLPEDTTKKDIYSLEHLLQISEDFKEEYHWLNELLNFHQGINDKSLHYTEDQMVKVFKIRKTELETKLRMMGLVEEFLYWKGIPKQYDYDRLDNAEEAFKQLEKGVKGIKSEFKRQELTHAVFHLYASHKPD